MKITKAQIQKMIKEELEALEEQRSMLQPNYQELIDAYYRAKYSGEYPPGAFELSKEEEEAAKAAYEKHMKNLKAERSEGQKNARNIYIIIKNLEEFNPPGDSYYDFVGILQNIPDYITEAYKGQGGLYAQQTVGDKESPPTSALFDKLLSEMKVAKRKYERQTKIKRGDYEEYLRNKKQGLNATLTKDLDYNHHERGMENAYNKAVRFIQNYKQHLTALEKAAQMAQKLNLGFNKERGKQQNFFQKAAKKVGSFFGLEENLTLTAEELDRIINEEIQNITKGN